MHVALVTETYPPEVNGVAMTLARLVRGLCRRGHAVEVVRPRQAYEESCGAGETERLVSSAPLPFYPALRLGLPCRRALGRAWRESRPDVVHVATEGPLGVSAQQAAHDLRVPVSTSYHTDFATYSRHYGPARLLTGLVQAHLRSFHNRARLTLVPSPDARCRLVASGYRHVGVLGRGVDPASFHPRRRCEGRREAWAVAKDALVLVSVGRLAPEKNLDLLLAAFRAVRAVRSDARLVLVGDGPRLSTLRSEPQVVTVGAVPHGEVGAHLAAADMFLFPSLSETYGNVLVEAMCSGLPTVSFSYAASAVHVQDGVSGVQAPFGDGSAFVRGALALARDPDLRARMGRAARASMVAHGWEGVVARFERWLEWVRRPVRPLPRRAPAQAASGHADAAPSVVPRSSGPLRPATTSAVHPPRPAGGGARRKLAPDLASPAAREFPPETPPPERWRASSCSP